MSKEKVTKDKFFEFLDDVLFIRKEYKDGKWPTVTAQERDVIYSIYTEAEDDKDIEKDMENACAILEPIYMKYKKQKEIKSTERTPKEIVQAIYFIIMRDYIKRLKADEKKLKANGSKVKDLKILSEDGKLRRYIQTDSTNETFIKLGEKSSRLQERMGIRPRKDFTDLYYEPVGFRSIKERGKILREMILSILFQLEYPMLIDLSGDNTILEDIYYCDTEVIYCSDSNAANFYNALKFQYTEFSRYVIESVRDMDDDIEETVKDFERILKERKINGREEYDEKCSKSIMKKIASQEMHNPRTLLTYPAEYNAIDIDLAYKYFFVKWMKDKNESLEQVKEQLAKKLPQEVEWLQMRIEKAYIAWGSIEDFFTKINGYPTDIISLAKNASGQVVKSNVAKTFYENLNDTVERKKLRRNWNLQEKVKMK